MIENKCRVVVAIGNKYLVVAKNKCREVVGDKYWVMIVGNKYWVMIVGNKYWVVIENKCTITWWRFQVCRNEKP